MQEEIQDRREEGISNIENKNEKVKKERKID